MSNYINKVKAEMSNKITAVLVIVFTIARVIYGLAWVESGWGKLAWFTNGKIDAAGKIQTVIKNIAGPDVTRFDPLYINKIFGWIADHVFLGMPGVTDTLVVVFELGTGLAIILGFRVFWAALIMMFMNVQFMAGASFNNFGYIWTDLALMKFAKYAEVIGIDGILKAKKEDSSLIKTGKLEYAGK